MLKLTGSVTLAASTLLAGCATMGKPPMSGEPVTVESVIRQIKTDLAIYNEYANDHLGDKPAESACQGTLNFKVTKVAVTLVTATERSVEGNAGAALVVGGIKLGPSGSKSRSGKQTQSIKFTIEPNDEGPVKALSPADDGGFAATLIQLRRSMLAA
ncbi:MAG: trypco2 family protein, partial [Novosphingobium sp.]